MKAGLNIPGYTASIGAELLSTLVDLGVETIRVDLPDDGALAPIVGDFIDAPIRPMFLLHAASRHEALADAALEALGSDGYDLEVFNEPTGSRGPQTGPGDMVTWADYIEGILAVRHDARARGFTGRIYAGAPANIGPDWWGWLDDTMQRVPLDVDLAFHRYSYKTQDDPARPWPPFASRLDELDALHRIANGRAVACTELGYHTAPERIGWWDAWRDYHRVGPFDVQLSDEDVLAHLVADLRLAALGGLAAVYVYSLNDGPGAGYSDRWGIRYANGTWKPAARCFAEWRT